MRKLKKTGAWLLAAAGISGSAVQQLYSLTAQADEAAQVAPFVTPTQSLSPEKQAALKAALEALKAQYGEDTIAAIVQEWNAGKSPLVDEHALDHREWIESQPCSN